MKIVQVRVDDRAWKLLRHLCAETSNNQSTVIEQAILAYARTIGVPDEIIAKGITDGGQEDVA